MANILLCGSQTTKGIDVFASIKSQAQVNSLSRLKRHVVLKILKSDTSRHNKELAILLRLSDPSIKHPGKNHVVQLLDHFEHQGPNGTHLCLVFPMLISDGQAMCVRQKPRHADYVKAISKQILLGLDFLHEQDIIHTGTYYSPKFKQLRR